MKKINLVKERSTVSPYTKYRESFVIVELFMLRFQWKYPFSGSQNQKCDRRCRCVTLGLAPKATDGPILLKTSRNWYFEPEQICSESCFEKFQKSTPIGQNTRYFSKVVVVLIFGKLGCGLNIRPYSQHRCFWCKQAHYRHNFYIRTMEIGSLVQARLRSKGSNK